MSKESIKDLAKFLEPYPDNIKEITFWLREIVWDLFPDCNELIYDNYNAVALGWSPTEKAGDVFCSIAVYSNHINFGLNRGSEIPNSEKILNGTGSLYRKISIKDKSDFPKIKIKKLLKEAYNNSLKRLTAALAGHSGIQANQALKGATILKSISPVKRRPNK